MLKTIISILAFGSITHAVDPGFSKGNTVSATPIQGQVKVLCVGSQGTGSALYMCRDVALDPQAYDYFVGPQDGRADKVDLVAYHEDGSNRVKTVGYNGSQGRSTEAVNLWISTIFQNHCLNMA